MRTTSSITPGRHVRHKFLSATTAVGLMLTGVVAGAVLAPPASAAVSPIAPRSTTDVTTDGLPTVQINGVVWSQEIIGNTAYAGGEFTNARPAGSPSGVNTTPRGNIVAYNLTTGVMINSFAASLNNTVRTIAPSPDGTRIYVGGSFTSANGVNRYRIAAFNSTTGALITTFAPVLNYTVRTIVATNSTVYVGGAFTVANGQSRVRLAAFTASNGSLLSWNASADAQVNALVLTPDGQRLIAGGSFKNINGAPRYGLGAVSPATGATMPWNAQNIVRDAGQNSAILSLTTDDSFIYGTGYHYGAGGNLEGTFKADQVTGDIQWIEDCHGDTYDAKVVNGTVYTVSHAHYCGNIGGFPQSNPWTINQRHALAFTTATTGTILGPDPYGYTNWGGKPSPSMKAWFPDWMVGAYTGSNQAGWTVTGNSQYVVAGGEFLRVNNVPQQGIVRFAVKPIAPAKQGPKYNSVNFVPTLTSPAAGSVKVVFQSNSDKDDLALTYKVVRDGNTGSPVYTTTANSTYWNRPNLQFTDVGVSGGSHTYRLYATDPDGNTATGNPVSISVTGGASTAPTAAYVGTTNGLTLDVNGSTSSDPGGSITNYAWNFGDGATATGVMASHNYAAAGTYQVSLTVTDNSNLTNTVVKPFTVSSPGTPGVLADDQFNRTVTGGLGTADQGGAWTLTGSAANFSVGGGTGKAAMSTAGSQSTAKLNAVSASAVDLTAAISLSGTPTGGGVFTSLMARSSGAVDYRLKIVVNSAGKVTAAIIRTASGAETSLRALVVPGVTYTSGLVLNLRFQLLGTGTTTLNAKVWTGGAEPGSWLATATDSTAALQGAGAVGFTTYLSGTATSVPVTLIVDSFRAVTPA